MGARHVTANKAEPRLHHRDDYATALQLAMMLPRAGALESNLQILYNEANVYAPQIHAVGGFLMEIIKVSANSRTSAVAGAIAGVVREHHRAEVQAIGAGAVNQAVKALVLATGYLEDDGIHVVCVPEFVDVEIDGNVRTAVKLVVEPR